MTGTYWGSFLDPWREFENMSRMLARATEGGSDYPAVNVWIKNEEDAIVTTEIPGVDRNTIDISVSGNIVSISGKRPESWEEEDTCFHRREIRYGDFSKTVKLPFNVDADKVTATYQRGVLRITLPQREADKPKKISINSD